jgi:hypothetical protein
MTRSFLLVALLLPLGCSTAKPETAALAAAVDRFHRASNAERPARADALALVACTAADVCAAKVACVEATTKTAEALRIKGEAERVLSTAEGGQLDPADPAVKALPAKLDRATLLLDEGRRAMGACDRQILVLRERYDL